MREIDIWESILEGYDAENNDYDITISEGCWLVARVKELEAFIEAEGACYQKELFDKVKALEKANSELLRRNIMLKATEKERGE